MGQTSSASLSRQPAGGTCLLKRAAKGDIDLDVIAADPLLLLYTNRSGQNLAHVAARAGLLRVLKLLVALLSEQSDAIAAAVSKSMQEQDAKQTNAWWKADKALPWLHGSNAQQLLNLQEPALVVRTVLSWQSSKGVTPLMLACRSGHAECVALLLDNGGDPLLLEKTWRRSCLHYAAATGYASCVSTLLNQFRTVVALQEGGVTQEMLLQDVLLRDGGEVWKVCKFVDLRTSTGFSALHYAAFWGHTSVVRALLTAGASVLLQTANGGSRPSTELMVDRGNTPLHLAADNGHIMVAATLLAAHAEAMSQRFPASTHQHQQHPWEGQPSQDPRAAQNSNGDIPLTLAVAGRRPDVLTLLLDPRTPLMLLQSARLMGGGMFGVPKLSVMAKGVLHQHLSTCLDQVEMVQQQRTAEAVTAAAAAAGIDEEEEEGEDMFAFGDDVHAGMELLRTDTNHTALIDGSNLSAPAVDEELHEDMLCSSSYMSTGSSVSSSAVCSCGPIRPSSSASSLAGVLTGYCSSSTMAAMRGTPMIGKVACVGWDATCNSGSTIGLASAVALTHDISGSDSKRSSSSSTCYDITCSICFDEPSHAVLTGCKHKMCVRCARSVVAATTTTRPAVCPFCRLVVSGFVPA